MKNSDSKKSKLHQEIIELKKKLEADTTGHRESELALRKVGTSPIQHFQPKIAVQGMTSFITI